MLKHSLFFAYSVVAYYLRHRAEVEAYLADCEREAAQVRREVETRQGDMSDLRARLLARRNGSEGA